MKGKEGTGDPGGPDVNSGCYSSRSGLCPSGEKGFFANEVFDDSTKIFVAYKVFVIPLITRFQNFCILFNIVFEGTTNSAPYSNVGRSMPFANLRAPYGERPLPGSESL